MGSHRFTDALSIDGIFRYKDGEADYRQTWIDFAGAGNPRVAPDGTGTRSVYRSDAFSEQAAADIRVRYDVATGPLEHEFLLGVAYQYVTIGNSIIFLGGQSPINVYDPVYTDLPEAVFDEANLFDLGDTETEDFGLYLNDQISVGNWRINLGLRYDEVEQTATTSQEDDATSFSVGVLYEFENGVSPYASFAESFEPVLGTDGLTGNPLKPREGEQWEVGVKYQPPGTRTFITAAYFDIEESNLPNPASLITAPNSQQEGVGTVTGFEVEALTYLGDWYLEGNLSMLNTETADGVPFASIPENQAAFWAQYESSSGRFDNFKAGLGVRYLGERESNSVASGVRVVTNSTVLADLLIGYETEDWDLTLNARNVTDEEYYGTCLARGDCFPGEERSVVARIARRF